VSAGAESRIFAPGILAGQAALITGGGTGLGRETALEFARCGASVAIAGRREDVLVEACALFGDEVPGAVVRAVAGDIRDPDAAGALVGAALAAAAGRLDVVVNNAGGQFFSPAELIATRGWEAVWRLNVEGMLNVSRAAREQAFAGRGGKIINVTLSPHHGMPGMAHSGAARAAVEALTRRLAREWAPDAISLFAVAAGHFDTEVMVKYPEIVRAGMSRAVPLQRLGRPEEHAWLVTYLATEAANALNGSTVTLDGARDNWFGPWPPEGLHDEGEVPVEERRARR
jgi:citronellol/citronellal dehydrogenase